MTEQSDTESRVPEATDGAQPPADARRLAPATRARIESMLEGVPLPATRKDLLRYARREGTRADVSVLERLPQKRFASLDEVGETLDPVQPRWARTDRLPRPESGLPPGGESYGVARS